MDRLLLLDFLGVAVFAASGALVAARHRRDIVAMIFFAALTGMGGGSVRDVVLDQPVFWLSQPGYALTAAAIAGLVWFVAGRLDRHERWLLWADAVGLSAYAVLGAAKALSLGTPPLTATVFGVMTATFGGILRDVVAGTPSVLLRREIYITAAFAGSAVYVLAEALGLGFWPAALAGSATALTLRAGALAFGWHLPGHRGTMAPADGERGVPSTIGDDPSDRQK